MKKDLHLSISVDEPEVMENIIEKLATRLYDMGYNKTVVPDSWKSIDTSSVEAYMSGRVEFDYNETQRIRIPYITCFLFSCTKEGNNIYALKWNMSLS